MYIGGYLTLSAPKLGGKCCISTISFLYSSGISGLISTLIESHSKSVYSKLLGEIELPDLLNSFSK